MGISGILDSSGVCVWGGGGLRDERGVEVGGCVLLHLLG